MPAVAEPPTQAPAAPQAAPETPRPAPVAPVAPADGPREMCWTPELYHAANAAGVFRGKRVELIRGKVIEMSAMGDRHKITATKADKVLSRLYDVPGERYVQEAKAERLPDSEPEPDLAVMRGDFEVPSNDPADVLLVLEVADSSLLSDRTVKMRLYAETGYAEYWILDTRGRRMMVHRRPLPDEQRYAETFDVAEDGEIAPLFAPDRPLRVGDLLARPGTAGDEAVQGRRRV